MFAADNLIRLALQEDISSGDVTTSTLIPKEREGRARIIAKENLVLAGIDIVSRVFAMIDPQTTVTPFCRDGDEVGQAKIIAEITGKAAVLLAGERTALNFLARLSGIASLTREYVDLVKGYPAKLLDTRKTTPGWRILEKDAVKAGGGTNHRVGLFDGMLIKDNHIQSCGGISKAIEKAKNNLSPRFKIEVEAQTLKEVEEALKSGADIIMLDNMDCAVMKKAVEIVKKRVLVEASGGINRKNIAEVAETGVDLISVGALTHSAQSKDISMEMVE